eukprot:CAMPEP_0178446606 /NCGR_PEP_ID=MMETSP0689_2-20121128/40904_1 /TAXON_ID=160604 /ORGANISM="Amphidinium massartii, Strain CS-259" /LENGTH=417 /DNA_ID=CAMNT_0020071463 /DNA_START=38 /DNA_END=1287 /DNA_ORIENTATION=-
MKKRPASSGSMPLPRNAKFRRQGVVATTDDAVAAAMASIPPQETRTKFELFRLALRHLNRGDEAISTGTRAQLGAALQRLSTQKAAGWYRVVAADGGFSAPGQMELLQHDGARPRPGESMTEWCGRVGFKFVGSYSLRHERRYIAPAMADDMQWNPTVVEGIRSPQFAQQRLELSGGKQFWPWGADRPSPPPFRVDKGRLKTALPSTSVQHRVAASFGSSAAAQLEADGICLLPKVLSPRESADLLRSASKTKFTTTVNLGGEAGMMGRYSFCTHLRRPQILNQLRKSLYSMLVDLMPKLGERFGKRLVNLEQRCLAAGQDKPASIFLAYGDGGVNWSHTDPYGDLFFPFQAMLMLSRSGRDFAGGSFYVKNSSTNRVVAVNPSEGDVVVFAANDHTGLPRLQGAGLKHGIQRVRPA